MNGGFWVNRYIFPFSGLLQAFLILISYCLSIHPFPNIFWLPYFSPKSFGFFCIHLLVCFRFISSQLLIELFFVILECPVLSVFFFLCRYLLHLLLSSVLSGLFPQFFLRCLLILFRLSFVLSFCPVFVDFLSAFPVEFPTLVLIFSFVLFEGMPVFSQTNFTPA